MKKFSTLIFLGGLMLVQPLLNAPARAELFSSDSGFYLPPRGYVVPSQGQTRAPQAQPAPRPAATAQKPRYPRPDAESSAPAPKKPVAAAPVKKKVPAKAEVAKTTSKPAPKIAKADTKKSAPAAKKLPAKEVASSAKKRNLDDQDEAPKKVASIRNSLEEARGTARQIKESAKKEVAAANAKLKSKSEELDSATPLPSSSKSLAAVKPAEKAQEPAPPRPTSSLATQAPAVAASQPATPVVSASESVKTSIVTKAERLPSHLLASASMLPLSTISMDEAPAQKSAPASAPMASEIVTPVVEKSVPPEIVTKVEVKPAPAPVAPPEPAPVIAKAKTPDAPAPVENKPEPVKELPTATLATLNLPTPPKAAVVNELPIAAIPDEEITAKPEVAAAPAKRPKAEPVAQAESLALPPLLDSPTLQPQKPLATAKPVEDKIRVTETATASAGEMPQARPSIPPIRPSMANVQRAEYRPSAMTTTTNSSTSSDFVPGGSGAPFLEPATAKPAPAFSLNPSLGTMTIDAERADSQSNKNLVTFNGNVEINCKRFQMKADQVVTNLRAADLGGGIEKVVGTGNVTVKMLGDDAPGYLASGNHAVYDPIKQTLKITGWPKIEEGNKALVASAAGTEFLIDTQTSHLTTTGSTKTVIKQ